jgi:5-methyltetrahydropteroyltriglutamate--homocysteine methyltransferase
MNRSADRILTTHAGALPRSDELKQMVFSKFEGKPYDAGVLAAKLKDEVADVVRRQAACGIDSVNDGELGKTNFTNYVRERLSGYEMRDHRPGVDPAPLDITARDQKDFPRYFASGKGALTGAALRRRAAVCVAPLKYAGQEALRDELRDFRAALQGVKVAEAFLPANTPGTIEHWLRNEHYKTDEEFVYAIAEAMREEYRAIVDAGFLLQIDDPDLADGWQMYPDMSVKDYRKYATLRVDALNHALRGIPREKVRLHACWGSFHGPHRHDIPLKDIVDIIFRVRASSYSIEASNPVHELEWRVFEDVKPPEGAVLIPGVVGHCCDFIEHPELVAQRLLRYAKLIGRENLMGGTDCGLGPRVGSPEIAWAKLEALAQGARLASKRLWMRPAKPSKKRAPARKKKAARR